MLNRLRSLSSLSQMSRTLRLLTRGTRAPLFSSSALGNFTALLDTTQRSVVEDERRLLHSLHEELQGLGTPQEELQILRDAITQIDELFMVCVVGEFNAGKSTFINALLGDKWCEEGVLPTTAKVCVLKYGDKVSRRAQVDSFGDTHEDVEELRLPVRGGCWVGL